MKVYLHFTDKDGDPVIVPNDIVAIFTTADKTELKSFHGREVVRVTTQEERRVIRSRSGGEFEVTETTGEILKRIQAADQ